MASRIEQTLGQRLDLINRRRWDMDLHYRNVLNIREQLVGHKIDVENES